MWRIVNRAVYHRNLVRGVPHADFPLAAVTGFHRIVGIHFLLCGFQKREKVISQFLINVRAIESDSFSITIILAENQQIQISIYRNGFPNNISGGAAATVFPCQLKCGNSVRQAYPSSQVNDNLEATIQAAFDKAFHDAGVSLPETIIKQNKVPQGWTDATVGDFASVQTGPFGSQLHNEDYVESGTPIITVEHMDGKYIAHRNLPLVSQNDVDRLRKYDLHTGDIVFSRVGSVDRAVMVSQHEDGWLFSGRCLRVRPYDPNTGSYFLWWFNQPVIRQLVTASAVGATMPSINTSILNSIRIVFPQKDIVTQFCKMADGLIEIIATNLEEIRKLNDAREYIQLSLSR